jgi:hypothetical protein
LIPIKQYADGYVPTLGTTETGMADAFGSFWYIGAIKFFIVAYLLGRCYLAAVAGNTVYRLLYMLTLTPAMLTITHHTQWVLSTWVHMAMLLLPFLVLAKVNIRHSVRSRRQHVNGEYLMPADAAAEVIRHQVLLPAARTERAPGQ